MVVDLRRHAALGSDGRARSSGLVRAAEDLGRLQHAFRALRHDQLDGLRAEVRELRPAAASMASGGTVRVEAAPESSSTCWPRTMAADFACGSHFSLLRARQRRGHDAAR